MKKKETTKKNKNKIQNKKIIPILKTCLKMYIISQSKYEN
jgi:hypothetical protein